VKHLEALRRDVERFAKKHELKVEQISAFSDGLYRIELKEPEAASKPVLGFAPEEPSK